MRFHDVVLTLSGLGSAVIESFYIETREGYFFAAKGLEHPPDRLIAVLRYVQDGEKGDRTKGGERYRRIYSFDEQEAFIKATCPEYLVYDPVFRTKLQSVPRGSVRRMYDPRMRLRELLQVQTPTKIEQDAAAFALLLAEQSEIDQQSLGITGSLLIGLHTEQSDLDLVVFGKRHCMKLSGILREILDSGSYAHLSRLDTGGMEELYMQRMADTYMAFEDFVRLESRKVNQGRFRQRTYFIRFVQEAHEAGERYGDRSYTPMGRVSISASVSDDSEAIFTPCRYGVSGVRNVDGSDLPEIKEIISFRGRFCEQARVGESIVASGTLERVQTSRGDVSHRLLLGNSPKDTFLIN